MSPRVVLGAPLYGRVDYLPEALESLLAQSYRDMAVVAVDDASPDRTPEVLAAYADRDHRLRWERNPARIGMAANWRRAFALALALYPDAEYFAWASDHDVWHARWLEALVAELDRHPEAVLAYPRRVVIDGEGRAVGAPWSFETRGIADARARLRSAAWRMRAGDMVYGLFRVEALRRAGVFRPLLWPDRLLLAELTAEGRFHQVPEVLWTRRFASSETTRPTVRRQRRALYAGPPPPLARLPWWVGHGGSLVRTALVGPPGERSARMRFAARYLAVTAALMLATPLLRARNRVGRRLLAALPGLARPLGALERSAAARGRVLTLLPRAGSGPEGTIR